MKKVQEFQFSSSLTPPEIISALGALSWKENYSITKQREWQSLSFKYSYCHCDFQIIIIWWCTIKNETIFHIFSFYFKQWFQNLCPFPVRRHAEIFLITWNHFLFVRITWFFSRYFALQKEKEERKWRKIKGKRNLSSIVNSFLANTILDKQTKGKWSLCKMFVRIFCGFSCHSSISQFQRAVVI